MTDKHIVRVDFKKILKKNLTKYIAYLLSVVVYLIHYYWGGGGNNLNIVNIFMSNYC